MKDEQLVQEIFNNLSHKYDLLNDLFSFGMHRVWKKKLLLLLNPLKGEKWVDLCCGTGDLAISLAKIVSTSGEVCGIDSAKNTLNIAKKKCSSNTTLLIDWVESDLFDENNKLEYFDGAVMAYGLRNLADPLLGLKKIRKFLKPGGRAGVLDFNAHPDNSLGQKFQKFYLNKLVIPIASIFGFKEHFIYLDNSIKTFPNAKKQEILAIQAGFLKARHYSIAFGQMGILILKN